MWNVWLVVTKEDEEVSIATQEDRALLTISTAVKVWLTASLESVIRLPPSAESMQKGEDEITRKGVAYGNAWRCS